MSSYNRLGNKKGADNPMVPILVLLFSPVALYITLLISLSKNRKSPSIKSILSQSIVLLAMTFGLLIYQKNNSLILNRPWLTLGLFTIKKSNVIRWAILNLFLTLLVVSLSSVWIKKIQLKKSKHLEIY